MIYLPYDHAPTLALRGACIGAYEKAYGVKSGMWNGMQCEMEQHLVQHNNANCVAMPSNYPTHAQFKG